MGPAASRGGARRASGSRQHDDRRDRESDDPQIDEASRREHLEGRAGAGPEPGCAVSPSGEVRDPGVSLRARFLAYLIVLHLLLAGLAAWLIAGNRLWPVGA